jgi:uncharacterized protein (DUF2062 family)
MTLPTSNSPPTAKIHRKRRGYIIRWLDQKGISKRKLKRHWLFQKLGIRIFHSELWRFRYESIARGWLIGCLSACSPFLGLQIIMAIPFNILFRAHIPTTFLLILMTNPLTAPLYYSFSFFLGCKILDLPVKEFRDIETLLREGWMPLLTGCFTLGISIGIIGYFIIRYFGSCIRKKLHSPHHHN